MENLPAPIPQAAPAPMPEAPYDNTKYWWMLGGFVAGLIIMNYKLKKNMTTLKQQGYDQGWDEAHENVEKLCMFAQQNRWQPMDIAKVIRGDLQII